MPIRLSFPHALSAVVLGAAGVLAASAFPAPARATTRPAPRDCSELERAMQRAASEQGIAHALPQVLADSRVSRADAACLGERWHWSPAAPASAYVQPLLALVRSRQDATVRALAAVMLGKLATPTAPLVEELTQQLEHEREPDAAGAIMETLGDWLLQGHDLPWSAGFGLRRVLEAIADWPPAGASLPTKALHQGRIRALSGFRFARTDVREPAIRGLLRSVADPYAYGPLNDLLYSERTVSPELKRELFGTLSALADDVTYSFRASALKTLAIAAALYAGDTGSTADDGAHQPDAAGTDRLEALFGAALASPDAATREQGARGLGAIIRSHPARIPDLCALLSDPDEWVRVQAAHALGRLPALPAQAIPSLRRMAEHGLHDAAASIDALARDASPEGAAFLVHLLRRPEPVIKVRRRDADRLEDAEPVELHAAIYRALRAIGKPAVLPLLAQLGATRSEAERKTLAATLQAIGWQEGVVHADELTAALGPALASADAHTRRIARSLLAAWRPRADRPYPDGVAETAAMEWFSIPADAPAIEPVRTHTMFFVEGAEAVSDPEVDAATVIGNSTSATAARRMIRWMCSGRRLQTGSVINAIIGQADAPDGQLDTIEDSLAAMGNAAALPVIDALAKPASRHCADTLFNALFRMDLDGDDPALVARMLGALGSRVPGLRAAVLGQLARMPDLPPAAAAPLLAFANGRWPHAERMLAVAALHNIAGSRPARPRGWPAPGRTAAALAMPPSWVGKEPGHPRQLWALTAAETKEQADALREESAPLLAHEDAAADAWLALAGRVVYLGRAGSDAVPALLKGLQHPLAQVREAAAHGLGRAGALEAVPALTAARADPASRLARSARLALRRIAIANPH